ncbi:MAG: phosphohydrolase [Candidatus Cloacimonadota bacterium]|nr:phosphohydrolase [Candidatus Cloacimonadota bacterium]
MKKSKKQINLEAKILSKLSGKSASVASLIFADKEIQTLQDYANIVSIKRLGFNDHGPVHMRKAALNSLLMFDLLHKAGIKFNLEKEGIGTVEDSKIAVLIASLLHDIGMTASRDNHETLSVILALPIINRLLSKIYNESGKIVIMQSLIIEGIIGHMATQKIHSLEAGLVLIGDGCDMEKGRARIPTLLSQSPRVGDIHKYSSSSIQKVSISSGDKKPIKIVVEMTQSVGFYQIEEVLFPKILSSPVKPYIELYGEVKDEKRLRYL